MERNDMSGALVKPMENLIYLGGFIEEVVKGYMYESYSDYIVDAVFDHIETGKGAWDALVSVSKANSDYRVYKKRMCPVEEAYKPDPDFDEWHLDQSARVACERGENMQERFWSKWKISKKNKGALECLPVLCERVFFYYEGLDDGRPKGAEKIARLPEFMCPVCYIEEVLKLGEYCIEMAGMPIETFTELCEEYR